MENSVRRLGEYECFANSFKLTFERVKIAYEEVLNFWQNASARDKLNYRSTFVEFTANFTTSALNVRQEFWKEKDYCNMLKSLDIIEKQLKRIVCWYELHETVHAIRLETDIASCTKLKLLTVHTTPRKSFPKECLKIIKESVSSRHYAINCQWLWVHYIPKTRYGLPHVPCIAGQHGLVNPDKRKAMKYKLNTAPSLEYLLELNGIGNGCAYCKAKLKPEDNHAILDCCNHLVCSYCKTLHSWKEEW